MKNIRFLLITISFLFAANLDAQVRPGDDFYSLIQQALGTEKGSRRPVLRLNPVCVDGSYLVDKTEGELGELYTRKTKVPF